MWHFIHSTSMQLDLIYLYLRIIGRFRPYVLFVGRWHIKSSLISFLVLSLGMYKYICISCFRGYPSPKDGLLDTSEYIYTFNLITICLIYICVNIDLRLFYCWFISSRVYFKGYNWCSSCNILPFLFLSVVSSFLLQVYLWRYRDCDYIP